MHNTEAIPYDILVEANTAEHSPWFLAVFLDSVIKALKKAIFTKETCVFSAFLESLFTNSSCNVKFVKVYSRKISQDGMSNIYVMQYSYSASLTTIL